MNPFLLVKSDEMTILRMDLAPDVGRGVRELFINAARAFEDGIEELITFDPGYQLQDGECFQIDDFKMPEELLAVCKQPLSANRLNVGDLQNLRIKSIVGYDFSGRKRRLYFQSFDSRRVLIPGKQFAIFSTADTSTFQMLSESVVLMDANLVAIWEDGLLKFKSFHLARQIFDLSDYFNEATDEQIALFIKHELLICDDSNRILRICTAWSRKKIALISRGGILDRVSIDSVQAAGTSVGYKVPITDGRIAVPVEAKDLKALLQFLDEDIYTGPISQRRLISSSKREV